MSVKPGPQFVGMPFAVQEVPLGHDYAVKLSARGAGDSEERGWMTYGTNLQVRPGEIGKVETHSQYRRQGVASALLTYGRLIAPHIGVAPRHSTLLTPEGRDFASSTPENDMPDPKNFTEHRKPKGRGRNG